MSSNAIMPAGPCNFCLLCVSQVRINVNIWIPVTCVVIKTLCVSLLFFCGSVGMPL